MRNQTPHSAHLKTPFELWRDRKPDGRRLHIFGSPVTVLLLEKNRKKLDNRSVKGIFIGYPALPTGHRILLPIGQIIESSDVHFFETRILQRDIAQLQPLPRVLDNLPDTNSTEPRPTETDTADRATSDHDESDEEDPLGIVPSLSPNSPDSRVLAPTDSASISPTDPALSTTDNSDPTAILQTNPIDFSRPLSTAIPQRNRFFTSASAYRSPTCILEKT